ncbi:MAG: hypothetical protein NZ473_05995 [Candidatus Kapabacteria bacterium]|nr:hypothetical protein [Candidatus Kapabacteria bacterium]MCS7169535.1 hypothetical protein [Candidatus Kapabacteria bacterium]MDW7997100.1 hypothetical protein [Bacteroidota bacterium]MDW8224941.1 hypothetical protein [Bacteroidota bacterium]
MALFMMLVGIMGLVQGCRSTPPEAPIEGEILVGQGGGFTGLYSGHLVHSDGLVFRWSQMPGQPERLEAAGSVPADSLQPFLRQLAQWEREQFSVTGSSNIIAFVEFRHADRRYRLQWGLGEEVSSEIQGFYVALLQFLRRHLP